MAELYDMEIDRVALVDRAANRRRFLILKRERRSGVEKIERMLSDLEE